MDVLPQDPHLAALSIALRDELRWARAEHERLLRLPLSDRIAAGITWPAMRLHSHDQLRRSLQVALQSASGTDLHDGITPGDLVLIAPVASPDRGLDGRCVFSEGSLAEVRLNDTEELPGWLEGGHVAVTLVIDPTTTVRYQQALLRVDQHDSPLRDALLDAEAPPLNPTGSERLTGLNAAQQRAGAAALNAPALSLIHGPPGTGKTTLMVRLLQALSADKTRPWALASSNAAVDHLATSAAAAGLEVLRLGAPYRVSAAARPLTFEARAARGPYAAALAALDQEISRGSPAERRSLYRQRRELLRQIRREVIDSCDVIASTLGTMAREASDLPPTSVALVDEATQAVEPAIWSIVPFVERLILLGDPYQLGPVVQSPNNPLERSLLSRLLDGGLPAPMLEEQYRMSASLCALVTDTYGPSYRPHPAVADRLLPDLPRVSATSLTERSVLWIDTAGGGLEEARDPVTRSTYNAGEVELVILVVGQLLQAGVSASDIGVIAPYSAQVSRLRARLVDVEAATVNAFQGREKEVIICSFVRSNDSGDLGFVSDPRRLTVAVSRARRLLVCIGDAATLSVAEPFSTLMAATQRVDPSSWQSVWEPPWDAVLPS
ncbi:MAG: ATP-dependent RNA/DNA helicase IGHMBP2 [Myxococcota bacterium]|jgi:ATP-dependent RNA/DNA helicase IGHMBP2